MDRSRSRRCAAPLRAVLQSYEVAALLRIPNGTFWKRLRDGKLPAARRSFDRVGHVFDWRDVETLIEQTAATDTERERALRELLGLRSGALQVDGGRLVASRDRGNRRSPADELLDVELRDLLEEARQAVGEPLSPSAFDRWGAEHADGINHVDLLVRLSCGSWGALVGSAELPSQRQRVAGLAEPAAALRACAQDLGRAPSRTLFDKWAGTAGCPLRASGIARHFGSWTQALARSVDLAPSERSPAATPIAAD